jgi:hypothetical protein
VSALGEHGLRCAFGYPNEYAEPIIKRAGYADLGRLTRYVKVLSSKVLVDTYVRSPALARPVAALGRAGLDPLLSVVSRERLPRRRAGFRVEQPAEFDDRFAEVCESMGRQHRITSERTPELLNWKYEKGAGRETGVYRIFALLSGDDRVAAYAVHRSRNGIRHMVDIAFLPSRAVVDALLAEFILDARRERVPAVTLLHLGAANLLTRRLRAFGFLRRTDESGLRLYVPGDSPLDRDLVRTENWYFLTGDADV